MSSRKPVDIKIDGRVFTVKPLTLGQVRSICEVIEGHGFGSETTALNSLNLAMQVIEIGLRLDYPDVRTADLAIGFDQFDAISATILRQGGFAPSGEAVAAAERDPIGSTSEGASLQRSGKPRRK